MFLKIILVQLKVIIMKQLRAHEYLIFREIIQKQLQVQRFNVSGETKEHIQNQELLLLVEI